MPTRRMQSPSRDSAKRILKPLLRVLFAAGLTERELVEMCRRYARKYATTRQFALKTLPYRSSLEHVISRWITDAAFTRGSSPAPLKFTGKHSFTSLVRSAAPKLKASEALLELQRHKLVTGRRNGRLRLICPFFPVRGNRAIDLELFTKMTVDFLRTHEVNFLTNPPRGKGLFQRVAHRSISNPKVALEFNHYARAQGQQLLEAIDDWLARRQLKPPRTDSTGPRRIGMGIYLINETLR